MRSGPDPSESSVGAAGTVACPSCGARNPAAFRFCGACGKSLKAPPVPVVSGPVPTPSPNVAPPVPVAPAAPIPTDALGRERELQRLLTQVNVQRMRAQIVGAKKTLEQALLVAEQMPPTAAAPVYEMQGDLLAAEERWQPAKDAFEKALQAEPTRATAERKFAAMAVRLSDEAAMHTVQAALLRGDDLSDILRGGRENGSHAGLAMLLSLFMPGAGQFYNGHTAKGALLVGAFLLASAVVGASPDRTAFFRYLTHLIAGKHAVASFSPVIGAAVVVTIAVWLYALVDAPFSARRVARIDPNAGVDRAGWEP